MGLKSRIWFFTAALALIIGAIACAGLYFYSKFSLQNELIYIAVAVIILIMLFGNLGSRLFFDPIEKLYLGLQQISAGKYGTRINLESKDETGEMATILNTMSEKVATSINGTTIEKKKLDIILQSIADAVVVLDEWKNIILVNRTTEELTGYSKNELIGKKYQEYLHFEYEKNEQENTALVEEVYQHGSVRPLTNHTLIVTKKGDKIPIAVSTAPIFGLTTVTGCVIIFRDVTFERSVEKMKDEFVSLASHQLRTPLTALRWLSESLQNDQNPPLSPAQKETVGNMRDSTLRLITLVNDLLNVGRIEAGRLIVEPAPTDLKKLTDTVLMDVGPRFVEKNQKIDLQANDLPEISVDPKLISQVLQNLITNASKYSPDNTSIKIQITVEGEFISTKVTDSGYGIPEEQQERLFSKFFRAENVKAIEGTGLGLYLAKKIVEVSGGEIGFKSPAGQDDKGNPCGTEFWFTLPLSGSQAQKGEVSLA